MSNIQNGRVRITDRSGRVCMDADVESIVSIHGPPEGSTANVLFASGHVAFLENVQLGHVIDMVWPRPDDKPAAEVGYGQPEADPPAEDAAG